MKKFLKFICCCLVLGILAINVSACSCSRVLKTKYVVNVTNEDGTVLDTLIEVKGVVTEKYREPANTPCYNSNGELIADSEGISKCYTEDLKEFERETYKLPEKKELSVYYPVYIENSKPVVTVETCYDANGEVIIDAELGTDCYSKNNEPFILGDHYSYTSNGFNVPKEKKHSLIYRFEITNKESSTIFIKAFDINQLTNGGLKEESYEKVTYTLPANVSEINGSQYFEIKKNETVVVEIELKGLTTKDLFSKKSKNLTINLPIVIY